MAINVVPIPAVGAVGSRPRKEAPTDTERWTGAKVLPSQIATFTSFNSYANAGMSGSTLTKQFARDTDLSGQQGLPAAHHHYWYGIRAKIRSMEADLSIVQNKTTSEQMNRARELSALQFRFAASELITCQMDEVPSGTGPQFINTTHTAVTVFSLPSGVPTRGNAKDVTISGRPVEIVALESFSVVILTPQPGVDPQTAVAFTLVTDLYVSIILEGLLLRGITG